MLISIRNWLSAHKLAAVLAGSLAMAACEESSSDGGGYPAGTPPGIATNIVISAGDTRVVFTFDAPTTGDAVNKYTATCQATDEDTVSAFSAKSPLTLSGMVNDVTYTCSFIASNNAGAGPDAGPLSVTPNTGFETTDCTPQTTTGGMVTCLSANYLDGVTTAQRNGSLFDLTEENATDFWSDRAVTAFSRAGVPLSSLSDDALSDAEALIESLFTAQGFAREEAIRLADDFLGETSTSFGADMYYIYFVGTPSYSAPWMLILTGHHYTLVASVEGDYVSLTPNFVGVEPKSFTVDGTTYAPLDDRQAALAAMLAGLSGGERDTANLGETFTDIELGNGDDGKFPATPEGLSLSGLTATKRDLVVAAIRTFTDDQAGTPLTDAYITDAVLDQTFIAWSTDADLVNEGAYVRIQGPRLWIEFIVVEGEATTELHYHSIWRDSELDYGGNFDFTD